MTDCPSSNIFSWHSKEIGTCKKTRRLALLLFLIEIGFAEMEIWHRIWKLANQFILLCASWFNETHKNEEGLHDFK